MSPLASDAPEPQPAAMPWLEELIVPSVVNVAVVREHRDRCANCQLRRVLYRIRVIGLAGDDQTEARCAPCWGIR